MVGQGEGERSFEKVTCTTYDVMITSEFKLQGNGGFRDCGAQG